MSLVLTRSLGKGMVISVGDKPILEIEVVRIKGKQVRLMFTQMSEQFIGIDRAEKFEEEQLKRQESKCQV